MFKRASSKFNRFCSPLFLLFNNTAVGNASDSIWAPTSSYSFEFVSAGAFSSVAWLIGDLLVILFFFRFSAVLFGFPGISSCQTAWLNLLSYCP